jgi:hypothetical protein
MLVGSVHPVWHNDRKRAADAGGPRYYAPIPVGFNFLMADPSIHGPVTAESFAAQVVPFLRITKASGKAVVLVAQAFRDEMRQMPTAEQMAWWCDLAYQERLAGLAWFCCEFPGQSTDPRQGPAAGLSVYPEQLAFAQRYFRGQSLVPVDVPLMARGVVTA